MAGFFRVTIVRSFTELFVIFQDGSYINQINCHQPAQVKMNLRQVQVRKVCLKVQIQMIKAQIKKVQEKLKAQSVAEKDMIPLMRRRDRVQQ